MSVHLLNKLEHISHIHYNRYIYLYIACNICNACGFIASIFRAAHRKKKASKATTQNTMTSWPVRLLQNLVIAPARQIMVIGERIVRCMIFFFFAETLVTIGL